MSDRFAGRVALVTGGSRGIGRAIALRLASEGADVAVGYFRNRAGAEKTAAEIGEMGRRAISIKGHLGEPDKVAEVASRARESLGPPTIVVSNAASGVLRPLAELDERGWNWTLDINCRALLFLAQQTATEMTARGGGAIVALSSLGSQRVIPGYGAVGVSKAALESLVRYLAVEYGASGVRVNAVSAGVVDTEALKHFPNHEEILAAGRNTPAGRGLVPEDVAAAVAFLCSDDASMVRGHVLVVDGGYSVVS